MILSKPSIIGKFWAQRHSGKMILFRRGLTVKTSNRLSLSVYFYSKRRMDVALKQRKVMSRWHSI